ncbi:MAG: hypothetical protein BGP06_16890 [Rhizobiales bacterium 65-9]|mgnify:CR=1 FL=1|nr:DUF1127 domain-containing protein [Hyphomicrobiales bacterium]OJY38113.1 MAG: hypothetical protein BGP06_16890 [Rhizobiales bacterium 65-9]
MTLTLTAAQTIGSLAQTLREAARPGLRKLHAFIAARQNRRALADLAGSDERMLKDIGLTRSEVAGALEVGFGEDPTALLRRESGLGAFEKPGSRIVQVAPRARLPVVQGYWQGIA